MKTCAWGGKIAYESEQKAKIARDTLDQKGINVKSLRVYKCPNCFKYHFTSRKS